MAPVELYCIDSKILKHPVSLSFVYSIVFAFHSTIRPTRVGRHAPFAADRPMLHLRPPTVGCSAG